MGKIYYRDHEFSAPLTNILDVQINNTSIVDHQIASIPILTGTDGNSNGAAGLVPQPTTTDRNKFLKSDGTWAIPSGGGSGGTADYEELANLPSINSHQLLGNSTFAQLGLGDYVASLVLNLFYPIGSYYETSDTTFDPNIEWGGTWILETEGQVHISAGQNYIVGDTGGEATHTLTTTEMPVHSHGVTGGGVAAQTADGNRDWLVAGYSGTSYPHNMPFTINNAGGGQAHNNMQPYIVVNRWHRTA